MISISFVQSQAERSLIIECEWKQPGLIARTVGRRYCCCRFPGVPLCVDRHATKVGLTAARCASGFRYRVSGFGLRGREGSHGETRICKVPMDRCHFWTILVLKKTERCRCGWREEVRVPAQIEPAQMPAQFPHNAITCGLGETMPNLLPSLSSAFAPSSSAPAGEDAMQAKACCLRWLGLCC